MSRDLHRYAAVNARVRTLRGALLGREGLESLCTAPSMAAVMEALRQTAYASSAPADMPLEALLHGRRAATGTALLGLLAGPEYAFISLYLRRDEVEALKVVIRPVYAGLPWSAVSTYATPSARPLGPQFESLTGARDLRDLVQRLASTGYDAPLRAALPHTGSVGPFALEVALELDYYHRLWAATEALRPADGVRACRLLGTLFDTLNRAWVARHRDAGLSPQEILNYTLRHGRRLDDPTLRRLAAEQSSVPETPAAEPLQPGAEDSPGFDAVHDPWAQRWRELALEARRSLLGYPFHIGVPLGFLIAQDLELRDLRIIIAGKRIGVSAMELAARLATVEQ